MCPADDISGTSRGYIIPIGGAEEKLNSPDILDRFVDVCGGKESRIGIIPTASELEDTGRNYEKLFRKIGVKHARVLPFITREDCQTGVDVDYIESCDGVFMTGGNQLRLSTTLGGTKVAWGGPPVASHEWRNRHSFYLVAGDGGLGLEVERLVSLGATELPVGEDGSICLSDPDGNEFLIGSR
jgi:cyanophycinase